MAAQSSYPVRWLDWLRLMRFPNVFTAIADVVMGFWFTHKTLVPVPLFLLALSSVCLYLSGMVFNDLFDVAQDSHERPQRPLPSGKISVAEARRLAIGLMLFGCLAAFAGSHFPSLHRPAIISLLLAALILSYDALLKRTPLGPLAMGGCRFLNVLLGMSTATQPWIAANYIVAGGIGVYIIGVTWFARREAAQSSKLHLLAGLLTMLAGIAMLWSFPKLIQQAEQTQILSNPLYWSLLWIAIVLLIGWRFIRAIAQPQPHLVQSAIKTGILSIIVLDAAVVLGMRGCWPAIAVLALLIPAILFGRWVYST